MRQARWIGNEHLPFPFRGPFVCFYEFIEEDMLRESKFDSSAAVLLSVVLIRGDSNANTEVLCEFSLRAVKDASELG